MNETELNILAYSLIDKLEVTPVNIHDSQVEDKKTIKGVGTPYDIGKIENAVRYKSDDYDNTILIHKVIGKNTVGYGEKSYVEIQNIADKIIEIPYFNNLTDYKFIEREIFNWVVQIYENGKADFELINYLKIKIENQLHDYEFYFKIFSLGIEEEFTIGKVKFLALDKNFFKEEFTKMGFNPAEKDKDHLNNIVNEYTSKIVASTKSYATSDKAYNLSIFNVKIALDAIKIFMLWESIGSVKLPYLEESNAQHFLSYMGRSKLNNFLTFGFSNGKQPTIIDKQKLNELNSLGLEKVSAFLLLDKQDELYTEIVNGIKLLGEANSTSTLYERIVKIISFFESFLIPEGNTAAKGLTYIRTLITKVNGPSDLITIMRKIYDIRDKYLHNRIEKKVNPYDLYKVQLFSLVFIINLIEFNTIFKTKKEVQLHLGISNKR